MHIDTSAYSIDMVAGASADLPMPASFGENGGAATPGPGQATRPAPAGASPVAKRPAVWVRAPVPPAPGRDMIASELTHAMQQVMAQSQNDQVWFGQLHEEMGAHVEHINAHAVKMVGALHSIDSIREDARKAFDKIEQNDLSIKSIVDGHVQALYKSNETTLQGTDSGLRAHVQTEIRSLHEIISAIGDSGPKGAPTGDAAADSVLEARLMSKTQQIESDMRALHGDLQTASRLCRKRPKRTNRQLELYGSTSSAWTPASRRLWVIWHSACRQSKGAQPQLPQPRSTSTRRHTKHPLRDQPRRELDHRHGHTAYQCSPRSLASPLLGSNVELSQRPPQHQSHKRQRPPFWQEEPTAALRHHRVAEEHHLNTTVCHPGMTTTAAADV